MYKKNRKKILFVSHKANRSGAPLVLLEIIKSFREKSKIPFSILIMEDGELTREFQLIGKTYVWKNNKQRAYKSFFKWASGLISRFSKVITAAYILFRVRDTSVVFLNTITNGHIQKKLQFLKGRFICYVHEMEAAIHNSNNSSTWNTILTTTDLFLVVSQAVKNNLVNNHHISGDCIEVLRYPVKYVLRDKQEHSDYIETFKTTHRIPADSIIIGITGAVEWRKGFDLFLPLISVYRSLFTGSNVYFAWKGLRKEAYSYYYDIYDYQKIKANGQILLLPHGNDNIPTISCFDIHLLLSREDPYPLVVLEAASFGIPTICFAESGGGTEFIEDDCGFCVPYLNLVSMAEKLNELVQNQELRNQMGLNAQAKLSSWHTIDNTMPAFIKILEN